MHSFHAQVHYSYLLKLSELFVHMQFIVWGVFLHWIVVLVCMYLTFATVPLNMWFCIFSYLLCYCSAEHMPKKNHDKISSTDNRITCEWLDFQNYWINVDHHFGLNSILFQFQNEGNPLYKWILSTTNFRTIHIQCIQEGCTLPELKHEHPR